MKTKLNFKKREVKAESDNEFDTCYSPFFKKTLIIPKNPQKYLGSVYKCANKWRVKIEVSEKSHYVPFSLYIFNSFDDEESAKEFHKLSCIQNSLFRNRMYDMGNYIEMELTNRGTVKFDKDDLELVDKYLWFATQTNGGIYARRSCLENEKDDESRCRYALHNEIMNFIPNVDGTGDSIDHINRDTMDNRKYNLRIATKLEQIQNRDTSKQIGIVGHKNIILGKKPNGSEFYELRLSVNGKRKRLYYFWSEHGGAQGALNKAIESRDKLKISIKDANIRKKLENNEITLRDLL